MDNWPGSDLETMSREKLDIRGLRRVVGVTNPFAAEFVEFLRYRFGESGHE